MESNILKVAKELFHYYNGSKFMMGRDEILDKYLSYNIPREIEIKWINEMFDEKYKQLDVNNSNSLILMGSFIRKHIHLLFNRISIIEKYITENLNKCMDIMGAQILVNSILEELNRIDDIDVKKEITAFERLKKKIRIRKIKLMIWNCMNPVFVIRSIYNWLSDLYHKIS